MDPAERALLVQFCRCSDTRLVPTVPDEHPCRFFPEKVQVPREPGVFFTEAGAFELIADHIEGGNAVRLVPMKKPAGTFGFQMRITIEAGKPDLYWKLTFNRKRTRIYGRSFHYNDE